MSGALEMWVVYSNSRDFPGREVARKHLVTSNGTTPTSDLIEGSIGRIRSVLSDKGMVCLHRHPTDDPVIVETWV